MKPDLYPTPQRLCHHCGRWLWLVAYHGHKCVPRHEPANAPVKPGPTQLGLGLEPGVRRGSDGAKKCVN